MRAISLLFHDVYAADPRESGFASDAADRYKLSIVELDAQLAGVQRTRPDAPAVVEHRLPPPHATETQRHEAETRRPSVSASLWPIDSAHIAPVPYLITADDGGVSYYTVLAERLESRGWRGHCFVATDFVGTPGFLTVSQIRDLDARGHVIGSHSASHPARFSACHPDAMRREWLRSRLALEDLLGHSVNAGSVPGGYYSRGVAEAAGDAGLRILFTSEPTTTIHLEHGIHVIGRFTLRRGHSPDMAARLAGTSPWTRSAEWTRWNAKALVKPVLGQAYPRLADRILRWKQGVPHAIGQR